MLTKTIHLLRQSRSKRKSGPHPGLEMLERRLAPAGLMLSITSPVDEGESATLTGTITNPPTAAFGVQLSWGDGGNDTLSLVAGTTTFSAAHVYADDNPTGTPSDSYPVTARLLVTTPSAQFADRLGGSGLDLGNGNLIDDDTANGVVTDSAGNIYTTGSFSGIVDFDPSPGTA